MYIHTYIHYIYITFTLHYIHTPYIHIIASTSYVFTPCLCYLCLHLKPSPSIPVPIPTSSILSSQCHLSPAVRAAAFRRARAAAAVRPVTPGVAATSATGPPRGRLAKEVASDED